MTKPQCGSNLLRILCVGQHVSSNPSVHIPIFILIKENFIPTFSEFFRPKTSHTDDQEDHPTDSKNHDSPSPDLKHRSLSIQQPQTVIPFPTNLFTDLKI